MNLQIADQSKNCFYLKTNWHNQKENYQDCVWDAVVKEIGRQPRTNAWSYGNSWTSSGSEILEQNAQSTSLAKFLHQAATF